MDNRYCIWKQWFTVKTLCICFLQKHRFSLHKTLTDGLEWCGLLWCFYQLFGLSFWRHPFTPEDPLVSKWCNATFLQICSDDETNAAASRMAWGRVNHTFLFLVKYCIEVTWRSDFTRRSKHQCIYIIKTAKVFLCKHMHVWTYNEHIDCYRIFYWFAFTKSAPAPCLDFANLIEYHNSRQLKRYILL